MASFTWLVAVVSFFVVPSWMGAQGDDKCYHPNGDLEPDDFPCGNLVAGACCPNGSYCMTNGLCMIESSATYERRTCTDQNWRSDVCLDMCIQSKFLP